MKVNAETYRCCYDFDLGIVPTSSCLQVSYLCYLCLFAYKGVQHTLCCVFVLFFFVVYPMLSVSMDVPLLIAPSVFSNVYFRQCDILCCSLQILMRDKLSKHDFSFLLKQAMEACALNP
jgi:hypothetical protein